MQKHRYPKKNCIGARRTAMECREIILGLGGDASGFVMAAGAVAQRKGVVLS